MDDVRRLEIMIEGAQKEIIDIDNQIQALHEDRAMTERLILRWKEKIRLAKNGGSATQLTPLTFADNDIYVKPELYDHFDKNEFETKTQKEAAKMILARTKQDLSLDEGIALMEWTGNPVGGGLRDKQRSNMSAIWSRLKPEVESVRRGRYRLKPVELPPSLTNGIPANQPGVSLSQREESVAENIAQEDQIPDPFDDEDNTEESSATEVVATTGRTEDVADGDMSGASQTTNPAPRP